jgi:hypothetical protein
MANITGNGRIAARANIPDGYYEGNVKVPIPDGYYEGGESIPLPVEKDRISLAENYLLSEPPNYIGLDLDAPQDQLFLAIDFGTPVAP